MNYNIINTILNKITVIDLLFIIHKYDNSFTLENVVQRMDIYR